MAKTSNLSLDWPLSKKAYKEALKHASKSVSYSNWSKKEVQYLKKYAGIRSAEQLAKEMGRTINAVRRKIYLIKIGKCDKILNSGKPIPWSKEEENFLVENFQKMSTLDIAKKINRSEAAVKCRIGLLKRKGALKEAKIKEITANKNTVPNDPQSPFVTSGIRLGAAAIICSSGPP